MTNSNRKPLVLLVEDDVNISKLFSYNLIKAGFDCALAENGQEGFNKALEVQPDLIISDIMMPEIDGFEFRKMVLQNAALKKIPFIFLTAKGDEDDVLQGYDLEIEDYLIKTSSPKIIIAKVSAILKSLEKERNKVVGEVQEAADNLAVKVVPDNFPQFAGFKINHWHVPFQNIPGGDFIDYINAGEDNLIVVLGDVMGKKWGAWYFAVAYAGYVRSAVRFALDSAEKITPADILNKVNASIEKDERISEVFITLSVVIVNKKTLSFSYAGAGDLPLIYKGKETKVIKSEGVLLGIKKDFNYETTTFTLNKGDEVFLITDGITESRDTNGEMFGAERLQSLISSCPPELETIEYIKDKFKEFTGNTFEDDISIISIKAED